MVTDANATPMRDHIARLVEMLSDGERRLIIEHPNPAIGTSVFSTEVSVAVAAALAHREAEAVAVKPLEWEPGVVDWAHPLPGMKYVACSTTPNGSWGWWLDGEPETRAVFPSEAEAKAAAQADYEHRIRSALVALPAQEPDFAASIAEVIKEESANEAACGWRSCTGCHETNEGAETGLYPYSKMFGCYVGSGCSECGGLGVVWDYWSKEALDEMQRDVTTPPAQEAVADDEAETVERNPKSWIAWKREAERLAKLDPIDLAKEKIDRLTRRADAGELVIATLITNLKTGNVSPEKAVEWWDSEGRAMLTAAQEGR